MFSGCTVPPDSMETELVSSDQEASPSAGKNTGVQGSFSPMFTHGSVSLQLFPVVWVFLRSLGVIVTTDEFSVNITKATLRIGVS